MSNALEGLVVPIGDKVLCGRVLPPDNIHGIIIPDNKIRMRLMKWRVIAVGEKVEQFKKDDVVLISWYLGIPVDILHEDNIDGEKYKLFMQTEIVGFWKGD